jgi:HemY protein
MFGILWFLFVASTITIGLTWLLDHNGSIVITWLGYQVQADIFPAVLAIIFIASIIFLVAYLLAKILSIKFPSFLKLFFRKNYTRQLERMVKRHHQAFEAIAQTLLALEVSDQKTAESLHKKSAKLVKNAQLNNFLLAKIFIVKKDYTKAAEVFERFGENKHAKILVLKSKFRAALKKDDQTSAIAYAKQILSVKFDNLDVVKSIHSLYLKHDLNQEAEELVEKYGDLK